MTIEQYTKEDLKMKIQRFFALMAERDREPSTFALCTLLELSIYLDIEKAELIQYPSAGKHGDTIRRAKQRCENDILDKMMRGKIEHRTGELILRTEFDLKEKGTPKEKPQRSIADIVSRAEKEVRDYQKKRAKRMGK